MRVERAFGVVRFVDVDCGPAKAGLAGGIAVHT